MEILYAAILGLVEGLTEFVPVSSSGHMIITSSLLGFDELVGHEVAGAFEVFIQLGAVLAIVLAYPGRFAGLLRWKERQGFAGVRGIGLVIVTTLPAALVGLALHGVIKHKLFNSTTVAIGLLLGGLWIVIQEWLRPRSKTEGLDAVGWKDALTVGLYQCLSLWPGMSRSSSTILGGMLSGLDRRTATEYSFFAAMVVIPAAGVFDVYKTLPHLSLSHVPMFAVGTLVSFLSGWMAVKWLIQYLSRHTLTAFGWYRIVVAILVLGVLW